MREKWSDIVKHWIVGLDTLVQLTGKYRQIWDLQIQKFPVVYARKWEVQKKSRISGRASFRVYIWC